MTIAEKLLSSKNPPIDEQQAECIALPNIKGISE
jgi:hypothetical protein